MVNMRGLRLVLFLVVVSAAKADTVTLRDSSSWNGRVTISPEGVLKLTGNFRSGKPITLTLGANWVRSIQFNPTVYNPGSDPPAIIQNQQPNGPFHGTIYMQNGPSQTCDTSITVDRPSDGRFTVSCVGSKPIEKPIRIVVNKTQ